MLKCYNNDICFKDTAVYYLPRKTLDCSMGFHYFPEQLAVNLTLLPIPVT